MTNQNAELMRAVAGGSGTPQAPAAISSPSLATGKKKDQ